MAPKYEEKKTDGNPVPTQQVVKPVISQPKTICKAITLPGSVKDSCSVIDSVISKMEIAGYEYKDHIDQSHNEKILIFKKVL